MHKKEKRKTAAAATVTSHTNTYNIYFIPFLFLANFRIASHIVNCELLSLFYGILCLNTCTKSRFLMVGSFASTSFLA